MLYPINNSFATHEIEIEKHFLHVEEVGNPKGYPILFLHGGPGSGCNKNQRAIFDPKKYRVIFPDQRGSGKSKPKRSLEKNDTNRLISDIELIRKKLKIKKWLVVGGSWGSTLAIAYAQKHADRVKGIVLRSLFLGTTNEVEWAFYKAAKIFKPRIYKELIKLIPEGNSNKFLDYLGSKLESSVLEEAIPAARIWGAYESALSSIDFNKDDTFNISDFNKVGNTEVYPNTPFLEWHYIKNNFFLKENQLFNNIRILNNIPAIIIQSNYDLLCPPSTSFHLKNKWDSATIKTVSKAGHYISDSGVQEEMIKAIEFILE